jgi:periplasmic divalent cation tolerance protein
MTEYIQIITSTDTERNAGEIADSLIRNRTAACVQVIGPITSTYWWKEAITKATEWLCIIKTRRDLYGNVESSIRRINTYEIPEIVALPVTEGNETYLAWLSEALQK